MFRVTTNHAILDKVIKERQKNVHLNIPLTKKFLEISGMTLNELDTLKVIHVSGTKGKGNFILIIVKKTIIRGLFKSQLSLNVHLYLIFDLRFNLCVL